MNTNEGRCWSKTYSSFLTVPSLGRNFFNSDTQARSFPLCPSSMGERAAGGIWDKAGHAYIAQPPFWEPPAHNTQGSQLCSSPALHFKRTCPCREDWWLVLKMRKPCLAIHLSHLRNLIFISNKAALNLYLLYFLSNVLTDASHKWREGFIY